MSDRPYTVEPGQADSPIEAIRFVSLPGRDTFARRADRLRFLAKGHAMGDFLGFLARLAEAQQLALDGAQSLPPFDSRQLSLCRDHGLPPLSARSWRRAPVWRDSLHAILRKMQETPLPPAAGSTVAELLREEGGALETLADRILAGELAGVHPGKLPFVAAALQVHWLQMATSLDGEAWGRPEEPDVCPVCGSLPLAGIVRGQGKDRGLRYLCCHLCAAQWHLVRLTCSTCRMGEGIEYFSLDGSDGAVKAESCTACGFYLKLLYEEKLNGMEVGADDLATLALDMLMERAGKVRSGPNLLYHPGMA